MISFVGSLTILFTVAAGQDLESQNGQLRKIPSGDLCLRDSQILRRSFQGESAYL